MRFARVALPIPFYPHTSTFDYVIPDELQGRLSPGSLVGLSFRGKKNLGARVGTFRHQHRRIKKIKIN